MLVKPNEPITDTIVTITSNSSQLKVSFPERNDLFRETIKSLSFRWDSICFCWLRTEWTGSAVDRCAETGRVLLEAGFMVDFPNEDSLQIAINKTYQKEPTATIYKVAKGEFENYFKVQWRYGNGLYDNAMRIKGARYCKPFVCIPKQRYREVLDFADYHHCGFSAGALNLIEAAKKELNDALVFSSKVSVQKTDNFEIIDELKD